jgi:hypothetical protein
MTNGFQLPEGCGTEAEHPKPEARFSSKVVNNFIEVGE